MLQKDSLGEDLGLGDAADVDGPGTDFDDLAAFANLWPIQIG